MGSVGATPAVRGRAHVTAASVQGGTRPVPPADLLRPSLILLWLAQLEVVLAFGCTSSVRSGGST